MSMLKDTVGMDLGQFLQEQYQEALKGFQKRRREALEKAFKIGKLELILRSQEGNEPTLWLVTVSTTPRLAMLFADIVYADSINVGELDTPENPMEMLIYEPKQTKPVDQIEQIAKHIPAFLRDLYSDQVLPPIYVYQNWATFKNGLFSAKITDDPLVTVQTSV